MKRAELLALAYASRFEAAQHCAGRDGITPQDVEAYDHLARIFRQIRDGKETLGGALDLYRAATESDDQNERAIARQIVFWLEKERATQ